MEVRGCRNGHRIDAEREQVINVADRGAPQGVGDETHLLLVGVGNADEPHPRKTGENARMVAPHDADSDHSHAQKLGRAAATMLRPSSGFEAIGFSTRTWMPRLMQARAIS